LKKALNIKEADLFLLNKSVSFLKCRALWGLKTLAASLSVSVPLSTGDNAPRFYFQLNSGVLPQ
jgi:hypothetical protein